MEDVEDEFHTARERVRRNWQEAFQKEDFILVLFWQGCERDLVQTKRKE